MRRKFVFVLLMLILFVACTPQATKTPIVILTATPESITSQPPNTLVPTNTAEVTTEQVTASPTLIPRYNNCTTVGLELYTAPNFKGDTAGLRVPRGAEIEVLAQGESDGKPYILVAYEGEQGYTSGYFVEPCLEDRPTRTA